jgi:uncharacterized coiled-coil protein SlyX
MTTTANTAIEAAVTQQHSNSAYYEQSTISEWWKMASITIGGILITTVVGYFTFSRDLITKDELNTELNNRFTPVLKETSLQTNAIIELQKSVIELNKSVGKVSGQIDVLIHKERRDLSNE